MSCDVYFNDVVLLLPYTGTNGGTTTTDVSNQANSVQFNTIDGGGVDLTTTNPPYAGLLSVAVPYANYLANYAVRVAFTSGAPLDIFTQPAWTIETYAAVTYNVSAVFGAQIIGYSGSAPPGGGGANQGFLISILDNGNGTVTVTVDGSTVFPGGGEVLNQTFSVATGSWNHVAVTWDGTTGRVFFNGTEFSTTAAHWGSGDGYSAPAFPDVIIGSNAQNNGFNQGSFISQTRVTSGIARYVASFTPLSAAFPVMACSTGAIPDIVGLTVAAANSAITGAGFIVGTATPVIPGPVGTVTSQFPTYPGTGTLGDPIDYDYATGITVPNVVNTSVAVVAPGVLAASGFVLGAITYAPNATIIAGNIISQSPAAGASATAGSGVDVVVSSGLPGLRVPDLYGLTQSDAITLLLSLGLVPGAIGSAPSQFVPPGEVQLQNPSAGTPVAAGSIVSFVLSLGVLAVGTVFDFEATVISQYANSPTILQLVQNLNEYIDQSANFANFFNYVWNVDTAVGFGLDIWGKIVGVNRLLHIPNTTDYVGFDTENSPPPPDWQTMASDQPPYNDPPVGGAMYTGYNATQAYLLLDDAYRQLILAKAFANICATTAPAINTILQNLYGPGTAWVLNTGPMSISYNLNFTPTAIQLAILEQSGIIPTPPAVAVVINTDV